MLPTIIVSHDPITLLLPSVSAVAILDRAPESPARVELHFDSGARVESADALDSETAMADVHNDPIVIVSVLLSRAVSNQPGDLPVRGQVVGAAGVTDIRFVSIGVSRDLLDAIADLLVLPADHLTDESFPGSAPAGA